MDLRQIQKEDVFGPLLFELTSLKVKVKGQGHQGQKTAFFGPFSGLHAVSV